MSTVRRSAVGTIREGFTTAPALAQGLFLTFVLAVVGAAGRVTIPILLQQSIDRGIGTDGVNLGLITRLCVLERHEAPACAASGLVGRPRIGGRT